MTRSKYKYIVVKEEKMTRITELTAPLSRKDALEVLNTIKKFGKKHKHLVKLKRVSTNYPGKLEVYIKK